MPSASLVPNSFRWAPHRPLLPAGYDGSGLDFNFRLALHEGDDLYDAHHGEILSHHRAIRGADVRELRVVFIAARDIPSQSHDVFRAGLCLRQHRADVLERLPHLRGQTLAVESALCVPTDLPGDKNLPAGDDDAVTVAARAGPLRGLQNLRAHVTHWFFSCTCLVEKLARDDQLLDFGCTLIDAQGANVAVQAFGDFSLHDP